MNTTTLVIGASDKPQRYSYKAIISLRQHNHTVYAIGMRSSIVSDVEIKTGFPEFKDVHTVTLYLNEKRQIDYYDYIIDNIKPSRIIMNPGAENNELKQKAKSAGIEVEEDCTLVMLSIGSF